MCNFKTISKRFYFEERRLLHYISVRNNLVKRWHKSDSIKLSIY